MGNDQLRIIDANINRLIEGFRVLEEIARMVLNNSVLTEKLKVSGLPTVVFISAKGDELHSLRAVGFLNPGEMLERMDKAAPQ